MNLYQTLANKLLDHEFVDFSFLDGSTYIRRAFFIGGRYYVYPYGDKKRVNLLQHGRVLPARSAYSWEPLTPKMKELHNGSV